MRKIWIFIYLYLGIGHLHQMIVRPKENEDAKRKPSNFIFWLATVISAIHALAYQRYENRLNRLTNTFSSYVEVLDDQVKTEIINGFISLQNKEVPVEPTIWPPWRVFDSFYNNEPLEDIVNNVASIAPRYIKYPKVESVGSFQGTISLDVPFQGKIKDKVLPSFSISNSTLRSFYTTNQFNLELSVFNTQVEYQTITNSWNIASSRFSSNVERNNFQLRAENSYLNSYYDHYYSLEFANSIVAFSEFRHDSFQASNTIFYASEIGGISGNRINNCVFYDMRIQVNEGLDDFLNSNIFIHCYVNGDYLSQINEFNSDSLEMVLDKKVDSILREFEMKKYERIEIKKEALRDIDLMK